VHELTASCCFVFFCFYCCGLFVLTFSLSCSAPCGTWQTMIDTSCNPAHLCNCVDHPADRNPFQKCIKNPIILPSTLNHDRKVRNCQAFLLSCRFVYFTSNAKYLLAFSRRWRGTEMLHSKFAQLRKTCLVPSA